MKGELEGTAEGSAVDEPADDGIGVALGLAVELGGVGLGGGDVVGGPGGPVRGGRDGDVHVVLEVLRLADVGPRVVARHRLHHQRLPKVLPSQPLRRQVPALSGPADVREGVPAEDAGQPERGARLHLHHRRRQPQPTRRLVRHPCTQPLQPQLNSTRAKKERTSSGDVEDELVAGPVLALEDGGGGGALVDEVRAPVVLLHVCKLQRPIAVHRYVTPLTIGSQCVRLSLEPQPEPPSSSLLERCMGSECLPGWSQ